MAGTRFDSRPVQRICFDFLSFTQSFQENLKKPSRFEATITFFFISSETLFTAILTLDNMQSKIQTAKLNKTKVNKAIRYVIKTVL
jgi:hypothetical protein